MNSNVYTTGSEIIFPLGIKKSSDEKFSSGVVVKYIDGNEKPFVQWNDGHTGNIALKHIITKEKYTQLTESGLNNDDVIEYLKLFNGHIYN